VEGRRANILVSIIIVAITHRILVYIALKSKILKIGMMGSLSVRPLLVEHAVNCSVRDDRTNVLCSVILGRTKHSTFGRDQPNIYVMFESHRLSITKHVRLNLAEHV